MKPEINFNSPLMRVIISIVLLFPIIIQAQDTRRIQPGKVYDPGAHIFSPRFGFKGVIPEGYSGVLPRESEVFLLSSLTLPAQIYVFGRTTGDLASLKSAWEKGVEIENNISLKAKSASIQNGVLSTEAVAAGPNMDKSKRAYAIARCGDSGPCVIGLAIMEAGVYDQVKKAADEFMASATFEAPSNASPYAGFDWRKFLTGKTLITYAVAQGGSKETQVDLCADGSFIAAASKKGIFKNNNPKYKGKLTGVWTADGVGEEGTLILDFKKDLPDLKVTLIINDEKITAQGDRYFVGESQKCK